MTEKTYMNVYRKCAIENEDELTVGPDNEGLGLVHIFAPPGTAGEYGEHIDIMFPPSLARVLAIAMFACADEIDRRDDA